MLTDTNLYLAVLWGPFHWVTSADYQGLLQVPREESRFSTSIIMTVTQTQSTSTVLVCLLSAGVSVACTWLGNLRGGLGPPGYRGDIKGWKKQKQYKYRLKHTKL